MTIHDPRQPVYIRRGRRYHAFASLDDMGKFDPWHSPGLWLHTQDGIARRMTKIADLENLPCSVAMFGSALAHKDELAKLISTKLHAPGGISASDLAADVLRWVAEKGAKP